MSSNSAVEVKGSMYTFLSLKLHTGDPDAVGQALADKVQQAPGFFANTPIVVDLTLIEDQADIDVPELLKTIRGHKLIPITVSVLDRENSLGASQKAAIDVPLVEAGSRKDEPGKNRTAASSGTASSEVDQTDTTAHNGAGDGAGTESGNSSLAADKQSVQPEAGNSPVISKEPETRSLDPVDLAMAGTEVEYIIKSPKLVTRPVRSGQQVYARECDLIVLGQIGPGAEIIADNNIHVYGALRGRALCGVAGNTKARIFCQSLEAELVSVAGNYKVLEEIPEELRGKPAQISFNNNKLMIEPL